MDIFLVILGAICVIIGLLGSVIPIIPGSPISYVGMSLLLLVDGCTYTTTYMLVMLGLPFLPWGLIVGPFLGAVVAEMLVGKTDEESIRAGVGSLIGNLLSIVLSIVLSGVMAYSFFAEVYRIYFG